MKGWVCIQMPANGIGMEGNEDDIEELRWNQLQTCIRRCSAYWFLQYQHVVLNRDEGLAQWAAIIVIDLCQSLIVNHQWVEDELPHST